MVVHKQSVDICNKTLICWGQVAAAFQKVGVLVRGLRSWMQVAHTVPISKLGFP